MAVPNTVTARVGNQNISIETGKLAKQADGSVVLRAGDSMVLVTAVSQREPKLGFDFFPLTVDYQERLSAAGRIPGSFFRREGRLTERETLISRLIDRSLRPLFPEGYQNDTQVIATVFSADNQYDTDVLALTGASFAMAVSDIPFPFQFAGVRVGRVAGSFIANPSETERDQSDIDIIMAANRDSIFMVEGGGKEVDENTMIEALLFGQRAIEPLLQAQEQMAKAVAAAKRKFEKVPLAEGVAARVREIALERVRKAYAQDEKHDRYGQLSQIKKEVVLELCDVGRPYAGKEKDVKQAFEDLKYEYMRRMITHENRRIGGRGTTQIRNITCEVGLLARAHGSALFTRGETQGLVTTTLGTSDDEQRMESLKGQSFRKFMMHYNFPPYSVGEVKPLRGAGRREIGHGILAERALRAVLPADDKFPYTIRVVSDILESNGSSSMATVCGGCLSLMDAGVPISAPIAGIAMGLIKEEDKIAILSDILGDEDHLGDMDFKVCGSGKGITSIQMDIKITGVDKQILTSALAQAREGRLHILKEMAKAIATPRADISKYAPKITTIRIPVSRIKDVIGPGGKVIKDIIARTGATIDIEDDGSVAIASPNSEGVEQAIKMIRALTQEAEVGKTYLGTVRRIMEFGAFVEIFPGTDGLVHISDLANSRVKKVEDVLKEGDEVLVKVVSVDRSGKIRLSRKEALAEQGGGDGKHGGGQHGGGQQQAAPPSVPKA
ncbi:MAG: polyribonucleotide nucleotidyltransferase [Deltaproteobacteria bacterium]|nr:MAG: polyribonucleotide nucleotidyltransferase [Deltaproteobacteria bacterium]